MVPALSNTFRPSARLGLISLFTDGILFFSSHSPPHKGYAATQAIHNGNDEDAHAMWPHTPSAMTTWACNNAPTPGLCLNDDAHMPASRDEDMQVRTCSHTGPGNQLCRSTGMYLSSFFPHTLTLCSPMACNSNAQPHR